MYQLGVLMILGEACYLDQWNRGTIILKTQGVYYPDEPCGCSIDL